MKRKFSPTNPIDPSPIRSSKNQFKAAKGDEAKTSEYAFFQKLKIDHANHTFHSHPPHRFSPRERSSRLKSSAKELRLPVEDVTRGVFLSPVEWNRASTTFGDICSTSTRRSMEEYNGTMRRTQTQYQDLFSMKRQKLRQWVADISFPGIDELCSKGYDFVSVLLSRLFPESNKDNSLKIPSSAQMLSDAKPKFVASPPSNIHSKNHHQISTRNFMDVEWDPYLDNYSPACWLGRSSKRILSNLDSKTGHAYNAIPEFNSAQVLSDAKPKFVASPSSNIHSNNHYQRSTRTFMDVEWDPYLDNYSSACWLGRSSKRTLSNLDSLTGYAYNAIPEFNSSEPTCELEGEGNAVAWIESGSTFSFPLENYGYCPSSYLRELDDLHYPDASLLQRKEHALLLGWDSKNVTNERISVSSQNTELIPYPVSLTSWGDSHEWSLDGFGGSGLCASPLICKHPSSFHSLPPPDLTNSFNNECKRHYIKDKEDIAADLDHCPFTLSHRPCFGRHYIEDEEKIAADFNHSTLTLSRRPSYLSLTEDFDQETTSDTSMSLLSPGHHHWFASKFPTERHHDNETESLLSSKLDFDLGRKCLSICDSSSKQYALIYPAIEFPGKEHISSRLLNVSEYENCLDSLSHRGVAHHFGNDIVDVQDLSSFYFQISLDRKRACPLLLDKSSWEVSEGEAHHTNSEAKYI